MRHPPKCYQRSGGNSTQTKSFDDSYRTHTLYEDFLLFARELSILLRESGWGYL